MTISYIKRKLKQMVDVDQAARLGEDWEAVKKSDAYSTSQLKLMVDEHGWLTISKVGKVASNRAWLLAQHADMHPDLQAHWLELMLQNKDDVERKNIAYLTDRVMLVRDGKQKYGTQLQKGKDKTYYVLRPLVDKNKLDEWRAEMKLVPIREYLALDYWEKDGGAYIDEEDYLEQTNKKVKA